ncbi:MAG TPA: antibiotic biosynthesis monooxygenase [Vicinamibacterales bacterium]|jgi:quinol monooxygenase YgiN
MIRRTIGLLSIVFLAASAIAGQTAPDTSLYAVSYVDVMPASRGPAVAALKQYRDASRKDDGYVRVEFFEQMGRPGHFAVLETWRDQKALDAHGTAAHTKQLLSTLQPIRSSGYDQRPYKTVSVGSAPASPGGQTIYVITHVDVIPNPQNDPPGLLKRLAETSRSEKGNVRFDVLQHTMRANHFTIVEAWQSERALDAHAAAAHTRQYRDTLQPMSGGPLDERLFKPVE